MNRRSLPLVAVLLAVAGCDFKETRSGQVVLTGSSAIPLVGRAGNAELVAGKAEITFKKGSSDNAIHIRVRQPNRPEVELEAKVAGDYTTGNFTLKGSEIGQPVDIASVRAVVITGPVQRDSRWEDQGNQTCRVDITYEPCDENWTLAFTAPSGAALGSFTSIKGRRCNENRGFPYSCHRSPQHEPRYPDFPRGPRNSAVLQGVLDSGAENIKFD